MNLTEAIEKYETLTPRERTIAVGVHVMGLRQAENPPNYPDLQTVVWWYDGASGVYFVPADWADSWAGTGAIIEKMRENGLEFDVWSETFQGGTRWVHAKFFNTPLGTAICDVYRALAHDAHVAVALAALRAIAAQEDK